ncbi:MAG TPA: hypothetical protein VG165_16770 [Solirubrobacteraceae bacterium]|jgi:hypothetical protein|nr:hypothetical protein [Solirubrobacteraceae bacterium]
MKPRTALTGALIAGALVVLPSTAMGAVTRCTGTISNQSTGSIEVPSGAGCVLVGDQVNGSVKIDAGAALSLGTESGSTGNTVVGSINGTGIQSFDSYLPGSTVTGSLALTGVTGVPDTGPLAAFGGTFLTDSANFLDALRVNGPTSITKGSGAAQWTDDNPDSFGGAFTYTNNGGFLQLEAGDTINGAMSLHGNTGGGELEDLTVNGSLLCGNSPLFTVLGGLSVTGHNAAAGGTC